MVIEPILPTLMKVLVVDDVKDNVELIEQILEDDCNVIPAYSGAECIEKALSEEPSLILLDVNMPAMDGYETMLKLQENVKTKDIPVIFASAYYKEAAMIVKGLELGAFDYLTKPIDEDILLAKVRVIKRLKFAEEMLGRSQKMEALGKLTGGIAHDYNNMLGVVLGYTSLLLEDETISTDPRLFRFAYEIQRAGGRAAKLTKKLLSFSRKESNQEEITNINALLLDEKDMLEKTLTSRIKLKFNLTENLWPTYLESNEMIDVILNMSINAMHAMETNGGTLTFTTSNVKINKTDSLWLQKDIGDYILLSITDTGGGITEEIKEKIFDPFFSTKGDKGTGLGLSQVYGFVERSAGSIQVYSELGLGTTFSIYFPRHYTNTIDNKLLDKENNGYIELKGTEYILVVDDEPKLLSFIAEILSQEGYKVLTANSAEQALKILETKSVDLLLSDIIMHGMDGYQLANIVQKKYPNIKIQLASGFTDDRHLNMIDNQLHKNLIHKPFESRTLLKKIRHLLDNKTDKLNSVSTNNKKPKHFIWSPENNIGIQQIDQDHRILVALINNAITIAKTSDIDNEEIPGVLSGLIDYAKFHFHREELLMNICEYPHTQQHQKEHQDLLTLIEVGLEDYKSGKIDTNALLNFLLNWLNNHINEMDKLFEPYIKEKGNDFEQALKS